MWPTCKAGLPGKGPCSTRRSSDGHPSATLGPLQRTPICSPFCFSKYLSHPVLECSLSCQTTCQAELRTLGASAEALTTSSAQASWWRKDISWRGGGHACGMATSLKALFHVLQMDGSQTLMATRITWRASETPPDACVAPIRDAD